ncbi:MAG: RagB/SusD family nutrient uptake outer membrane protein [Prolixibacteraceae bacterium]|nr:RagB/SusD family nutrient uptake outer membrane protein [Prolixibacteraceae bacterium]
MKKNYFIILLLAMLVSCSEDFLEEQTYGLIRPDNYFTTTDDLEKGVNALYANLQKLYRETATYSTCMGGDDVTTLPGGNKGAWLQFDIFSAQDNNANMGNIWGICYASIKQANVIISSIDNIVEPSDQPSFLQNQKKRALGQAYFVRAMAYYHLVRTWNEIPLITELTIDYEVSPSQAADIYTLIVNDLTQAESLVPADYNTAPDASNHEKNTSFARATSGSVKALLASVYLTMAGYPIKDESKYALAAQKAKEVIENADTYGYSLMENFADLWLFDNNLNSETVFGCYYNHKVGDGFNANMNAPLAYRPSDFGGWDDVFAEINFFNEFPEGPRKDATFITEGRASSSSSLLTWQEFESAHPYYKKWADIPGYDPENMAKWIDWRSSRSAMVMRYAEVLLIYAEAKAMSSGPDASAYAAINKVRNRAGLEDLPIGLSATEFRNAVIDERKWEFAGNEPNARWFDMVRTETVESATAKRHPNEIPLVNQPGKDRYFAPIPQADKILNPNL